MWAPSLFVVFCAAGCVSAHGFLCTITINGKIYNGNNPLENDKNASVIRAINDPNPNVGSSNPALNCGPGALTASQVADVNPGDGMTFKWINANYSNWPHDTGPMLTYMASCGSSTCDQFDATQARWFKISQVGRRNGSGFWAQKDISEGKVDNITIPSNLAPGNYLIRHECINLQFANQGPGKAEFYPGCSQIRVGGSQTGEPYESELVSLPGAYHDDDPGLYNPSGFDPNIYVFPGPAIAAFVSQAGSTGFDTTTNHTSGSSTFRWRRLDVNAPAYSPCGILISLIFAMACQIYF